ncbi:hypothetical protein ACWGS9_12070 [Bradyrhizobium sp. Arg314]
MAQPIANTFRLCKAAIRNFSPVFNAAICGIVSACPHMKGFTPARNKAVGYRLLVWLRQQMGFVLNDGS